MASNISYQIKLPQFEGPFDLLLFFIERDELDIYDIPISKITNEFLVYIHQQKELNIELSSEFILFVSTLMRIKSRLLLPRKEIDAEGNEVDPREELVQKILEYKKFKEASKELELKESVRILLQKRGNLQKELNTIGEESSEGTEIETLTLFRLMKTFERVMAKLDARNNRPVHTVVKYNYTMEDTRSQLLARVESGKTIVFDQIFSDCENRIHALFKFLSLLELSQLRYMTILVGEGKNNFIVEWNENRDEEIASAPAPQDTLSEDD